MRLLPPVELLGSCIVKNWGTRLKRPQFRILPIYRKCWHIFAIWTPSLGEVGEQSLHLVHQSYVDFIWTRDSPAIVEERIIQVLCMVSWSDIEEISSYAVAFICEVNVPFVANES